MNVTTIGIDLAKNTFSLCGNNIHGKVLFRKTLQLGKQLALQNVLQTHKAQTIIDLKRLRLIGFPG